MQRKMVELTDRIIETFLPFDPERIILFGSTARRDDDDVSDVDLIVVYDTDKRFLDRLEELYRSWKIPKAVDILAYTPLEFNRMASESAFLKKVLSEGIVIYERSH
jgi:predicted nucleotidyltransferase